MPDSILINHLFRWRFVILYTHMKKGYTYILECCDGSYYVGSTKDLALRFRQHQKGEGAIYTRSRLPVKLVYVEVFSHVALAFKREKQIQKWRREKKQALINDEANWLPVLALNYKLQRELGLM